MRKSTTDRMNDYDAVMMGVLAHFRPVGDGGDWRSPGAALTHTATPSQCPLWVMIRHRVTSASCLFFPSKQTFLARVARPLAAPVRLVEYYSHVLLLQNATVAS